MMFKMVVLSELFCEIDSIIWSHYLYERYRCNIYRINYCPKNIIVALIFFVNFHVNRDQNFIKNCLNSSPIKTTHFEWGKKWICLTVWRLTVREFVSRKMLTNIINSQYIVNVFIASDNVHFIAIHFRGF